MLLVRKIALVGFILVAGLVLFGLLPKSLSRRVARALLAVMVVGFGVRVGAYLLSLWNS